LVVGHYQPLADNPGIAPKPDQTRSLQSDQRTLARTFPRRKNPCRWSPRASDRPTL